METRKQPEQIKRITNLLLAPVVFLWSKETEKKLKKISVQENLSYMSNFFSLIIGSIVAIAVSIINEKISVICFLTEYPESAMLEP